MKNILLTENHRYSICYHTYNEYGDLMPESYEGVALLIAANVDEDEQGTLPLHLFELPDGTHAMFATKDIVSGA